MRNASSPHSVKMIGSEQKSEQERYNPLQCTDKLVILWSTPFP